MPIRDENPLKAIQFQYVTMVLIALNVAVFAFEASVGDPSVIASFAVVPSELLGFNGVGGAVPISPDAVHIPESYTLLSYMFFHGDILHLAGNMLFLWVFGDNVEDAMGHARFLVFYLACGIFAGLMHAFVANGGLGSTPAQLVFDSSQISPASAPLIGASGAVAGVIAAYLMLHPRVRVWVLAFRFIPLRITAALALGAWVLMQITMVLLPQVGPVAWWAHIGGLMAGAFLVIFLRRPGVPLFDRGFGLI